MTGHDGTETQGRLLQKDDEACVWMSAGLVAYKLCDRGFDCERCPFDEAMRGGAGRPETEEPVRSREPSGWLFPDDRRYHRGHVWVEDRREDRLRVGLDAFAARLLSHASLVVLPPEGSRIRQAEPGCWVGEERALVPLLSPLSGVVVRFNARAKSHPALVTCRPYDEGWLMEVAEGGAAGERRGLVGAEEMRRRAERQMEQLRARAVRDRGPAGAAVGATLPDGGEPMAALRRALGAQAYRRLILPFLGHKGRKLR